MAAVVPSHRQTHRVSPPSATPHTFSQSLVSSEQTPPATEPSSSASPNDSPAFPSIRRTQQLRPLKCANYVPAVLRKTEWPQAYTSSAQGIPITPPDSANASLSGSLEAVKNGRGSASRALNPASIPEFQNPERIFEEEWQSAEGPSSCTPGAEPTRLHWRPNMLSPFCSYAPCNRPFTFTLRRHHCRRCGLVYCYQHSSAQVPLNQDARFHPAGKPVRTCVTCEQDYRYWQKLRHYDGGLRSGTFAHRRANSEMAKPVGIRSPSAQPGEAAVASHLIEEEAGGDDALGKPGGVGGWVRNTKAIVSESLGFDRNWSTF